MRAKEKEKERDRWTDRERGTIRERESERQRKRQKKEGGGKGWMLAVRVHTFAKVSQKLLFHFYVALSKISDRIYTSIVITFSYALTISKTQLIKKTTK